MSAKIRPRTRTSYADAVTRTPMKFFASKNSAFKDVNMDLENSMGSCSLNDSSVQNSPESKESKSKKW